MPNPISQCKKCGGLNGAHLLTCPTLRLPAKPKPKPQGDK